MRQFLSIKNGVYDVETTCRLHKWVVYNVCQADDNVSQANIILILVYQGQRY